MRKFFIILIFGVLSNSIIFASDSLIVVMKSNDIQTFNIVEIQKLTFPVGSLKVHTRNKGEFIFQNTDIRYFSFKSNQSGTGIVVPASEKNFSLKLFPNPASNILNVEFTGYEGVAEVTLYNSTGGIVFVKYLNHNNPCIDVMNLEKGFYVCKVVSGQKTGVSVFAKK